jgi:hypothetical protein
MPRRLAEASHFAELIAGKEGKNQRQRETEKDGERDRDRDRDRGFEFESFERLDF